MSKVQISNLSGVDLNEITTDGHYRLSGGCTNVPITGGGWEQWTQLLVITGAYSDNTTQIMPIYWDGTIWVRTIKAPGTWTEWSRLATATPPQEFDLPLAAGIDPYGKSTYWKTQEGICFLTIAAHSASASIIDSSIIATLPEGFRPDMDTYAAGHGFTHSGTRIALDVQVSPDGTIKIWTASALEYCSCFVGFIAAS